MKRTVLCLIAFFQIVIIKAQTNSFFINAHAEDMPLFNSSKFITDIKAGNKVVLITLTAGDEGQGNTSFNGSSIPFYIACEKGLVYASKFCYDISFNSAILISPALQSVTVNGHSLSKYVYKNTVNYFMRLPDGGTAGAGYAQTGNVSLQKLYTGTISSLVAVDGSTAYTGWNDITNTIAAIINAENGTNATYINTPSINNIYNPSELSDHFYTGVAAQSAISTFNWAGINEYIGNNSSALAANLANTDFLNCSGVLSVYSYGLIENNYVTKFTNANKAYLPMDYFNALRIPNSCNVPAGLNASAITSNSALISWGAIAGTAGYDVEYKASSSNVWVTAASSLLTNSAPITGLNAGTLYDLRVKNKCGNAYSAYSTAQFTTSTVNICNPPAALTASNITVNSASVSWAAIGGATSYQLEYKLSAAANWTVINTALTTTATTITGLAANTLYQWRVKTNCTGGTSSGYTSAEFTTPALQGCGTPSNLITSNITSSGATISWNAVPGAVYYEVEYLQLSTGIWTVLSTTLTANTAALSNLQTNSTYIWSVQANCGNGVVGANNAMQFTTSASLSCAAPAGLATSSITSSGAVLTWNAAAGVSNYTVEYKQSSSGTWIVLASALAANTINLSALTASSGYDWRVKANCVNNAVSAYSNLTFTTSVAATCNKPANLYVTNVASSRVTMNWDPVPGASSYTVQIRLYGTSVWGTPAANITANSFTVTGLNYYTIYEWRIVTNCSNGASAPSDILIVLTSCIDFNEPNNSIGQATAVSITAVQNAQLTTAADVDYYRFVTSAPQTNFSVRIFNLPANYTLNLYNSAGQLLSTSQNAGTADENIIFNTAAAGTYYFGVVGVNGSFDSTRCYVYTVNSSATAMSAAQAAPGYVSLSGNTKGSPVGTVSIGNPSVKLSDSFLENKLQVFPQPATDVLNLQYLSDISATAAIKITDISGYLVQQKDVTVNRGINIIKINLLNLSSGMYVININNGAAVSSQKLVIAR